MAGEPEDHEVIVQKHYTQFLFLYVSDKRLASGSKAASHPLCGRGTDACLFVTGQHSVVHSLLPRNLGFLVKGDSSKKNVRL